MPPVRGRRQGESQLSRPRKHKRKSALAARAHRVAGSTEKPSRVVEPTAGKAAPTQEIAANQFSLPAGLQSSGDPIEGNPFPTDDPRHCVWQKASLNAEEELCRLHAGFLKKTPSDPQGFVAWMLDLCVGKFEVWAKRYIQIVWSEKAVRACDQWLFTYANSWLEMVGNNCPERVPKGYLLPELRSRLIERMEWWKAEARRYLSEQEAHAANSEQWTDAELMDAIPKLSPEDLVLLEQQGSIAKSQKREGLITADALLHTEFFKGLSYAFNLRSADKRAGMLLRAKLHEKSEFQPTPVVMNSGALSSRAETGGATDRRAAVDAYIREVFEKTGRRIKRTDFWRSAGYKSRTEFERWERKDPKNPNKVAHGNFTRILTDKPHLK